MPVGFLFLYALLCTVEPRFNEPRHNEVLDITEDFVAQIKMKQNLHLTKPGESEQISSVPRSFVKSGSTLCGKLVGAAKPTYIILTNLVVLFFINNMINAIL